MLRHKQDHITPLLTTPPSSPMTHRINSKPLHVAGKVGPQVVLESPGVGTLSWFSIEPFSLDVFWEGDQPYGWPF